MKLDEHDKRLKMLAEIYVNHTFVTTYLSVEDRRMIERVLSYRRYRNRHTARLNKIRKWYLQFIQE